MSDSQAKRLLRNLEGATYWAAIAPALARLPAALGYRVACWRGDWHFRFRAGKRTELIHNLRLVLGEELSPAAEQQVTSKLLAPSARGAARARAVPIGCLRQRGRIDRIPGTDA